MLLLFIFLIALNFNCLIMRFNISLDLKNDLATRLPSFDFGGAIVIKNNSHTVNYTYSTDPLTTAVTFCDTYKTISNTENICYIPTIIDNCNTSQDDFIFRLPHILKTIYGEITNLEQTIIISYIITALFLIIFFFGNFISSKSIRLLITILSIIFILILADRTLSAVILYKQMEFLTNRLDVDTIPEFLFQEKKNLMIINLCYLLFDVCCNVFIFSYIISNFKSQSNG